MTLMSLTFDAVSESAPGPKWVARWRRSWPAYEAWFVGRGGDNGPDRAECEAALGKYMPELVSVHARLTQLAGGGDRAARFLSTWCPPQYLGGCSLASLAKRGEVRLVRNYDLSPELNEGLLLHSAWTGTRVMGMVEFLWGLSDGVNDAGLSVALAYGGRVETGEGFGITTIVRYILETCETVEQGIAVLRRVPSHMAYNIALADKNGATAAIEVLPGGGIRKRKRAVATNHQKNRTADRAGFTRTVERMRHLKKVLKNNTRPESLAARFLRKPLFQQRYQEGFGTLFTAEYDPARGGLHLHWQDQSWAQTLADFDEGQRLVTYQPDQASANIPLPERELDIAVLIEQLVPALPPRIGRSLNAWSNGNSNATPNWAAFGRAFCQ